MEPDLRGARGLVLGAIASNLCRPELRRKSFVGELLFLALYAVFMLGLKWFAPGYIAAVWNLSALKGGLLCGIPPEELLFGFAFGLYWSGVYEHFTWSVGGNSGECKVKLNESIGDTGQQQR